MAGRYPPLPFVFRLLIWPLRILATLASLLAIALILFVSTWGEPGFSPESLIALFGLTLLVWIHPLSPWFLAVLGAMTVSSFLSGNPVGGLVGIGLVGLLWWLTRRGGTVSRSSRAGDRFHVLSPDAAMPGARRHIEAFERLGFERVGAYGARIGIVQVKVSVLLDAEQKSYASVTDAVLNVTSLFPGDRGLVTRNNELRALPPHVLINAESGASPEQLVESHRRALELVAERDHFPTTINPSETLEIAIASEQRVLAWKQPRSFDSRASSGPLWQRSGRYQQIDDWHGGADEPDQTS